ncbi:sugar transferase [Pleurocapsa sp. FMAR1]|uniref:sugar transferase n=1 Tax=Pleurocapsa sp. FMAR1 TaxID=3040204 RepID=UPI0029C8B7E6|nr:sugar transferase [Pleurocapsa sp. FMAR1]
MTANSQLISVKVVQGFVRKGFQSFLNLYRLNLSFPILDGNFIKRLFDIVFAFFILIVFSPLYLILMALIALNSQGPIFYVQQRIGKNHKPFNCIKFRTMVDNADEVLETMMQDCDQMRHEFQSSFKLKRDPRITKIGKFLRLTSLDEFPQFWNVLRGDMSVIGPRPLVPEELPKYGRKINTVLTIRPGITGLWQVSGRNDIPYPKRVKIDVYYATSHSWILDLWIVYKTIGVIVFPKNNGAY